MDFEFLKDRYDFELQRKEQLNAALTLPVAVLSGLGGAIVAMARSFTYRDELVTRAFLIALGLDLSAFLVCLVFLGLAYHRQHYRYLERLASLERWKQGYAEMLGRWGFPSYNVNTLLKEYLRGRIIEAADRNTENNDKRSIDLSRARASLFAVLFFTAAAGIPYVIDQVRNTNAEGQESSSPAIAEHPTSDSAAAPAEPDILGLIVRRR